MSTRRAPLSRRLVVVAILTVSVLGPALAGCSSTSAPPVSDAQRARIVTEFTDRAWSEVARNYPEALRPDLAPGATLADTDWGVQAVACMHNAGFVVVRTGATLQYSSSVGQSPLDFAVSTYNCTVANPRLGAVAVYLSKAQLGSLYDYYTTIVQPCLEVAGRPTTSPPERSIFIEQFFTYLWHPYDAVWKSKPDAATLASIERRCPPVPQWLELGTSR